MGWLLTGWGDHSRVTSFHLSSVILIFLFPVTAEVTAQVLTLRCRIPSLLLHCSVSRTSVRQDSGSYSISSGRARSTKATSSCPTGAALCSLPFALRQQLPWAVVETGCPPARLGDAASEKRPRSEGMSHIPQGQLKVAIRKPGYRLQKKHSFIAPFFKGGKKGKKNKNKNASQVSNK